MKNKLVQSIEIDTGKPFSCKIDERVSHNDTQWVYFAYGRHSLFGSNSISYCYHFTDIPSMWARTPDSVWLKKKYPLTNCLLKAGSVYFLLRCLSKFDHGKISEIQVADTFGVHC